MSLINDMLKDLEQRAPKSESTASLAGLSVSAKFDPRLRALYPFIIISVLMALFFVVFGLYLVSHKSSLHVVATTQRQPDASVETTVALTPQTVANSLIPVALVEPSLLTGVAMQVQDNVNSLQFLLNKDSLYHLEFNPEHNQLSVIFDRTKLLAALPKMDYVSSGIDDMQAFNDENGDLKLVLSLAPYTEVKRVEPGKTGELELDLSFRPGIDVHPTAMNANALPMTIQNPVVESAIEQAYQEAWQAETQGQDETAIRILSQLVDEHPRYQSGRELLARLLLRHRDTKSATRIIDEGLAVEPGSQVFAELKAHLLLDKGQVNEAIHLLEANAPGLDKNPNYHAFIAALYQKQGKAAMAANIYKQLLTLQPDNAKWWLGLGVSLDALGSHIQALEAYSNANTNGDLSPELKAYVETQLHNA